MALSPEDEMCLAILHAALAASRGLVVAAPNPRATKAALERARATDAALARLRITISRTNPEGEVWVENPPSDGAA